MILLKVTVLTGMVLLSAVARADSSALAHFKTIALLDGDWKLMPADQQEGGEEQGEQAQPVAQPGAFLPIGVETEHQDGAGRQGQKNFR